MISNLIFFQGNLRESHFFRFFFFFSLNFFFFVSQSKSEGLVLNIQIQYGIYILVHSPHRVCIGTSLHKGLFFVFFSLLPSFSSFHAKRTTIVKIMVVNGFLVALEHVPVFVVLSWMPTMFVLALLLLLLLVVVVVVVHFALTFMLLLHLLLRSVNVRNRRTHFVAFTRVAWHHATYKCYSRKDPMSSVNELLDA